MKLEEQLHGAVTVVRPEGPLIGDDAEHFKQRCLAVVQDSLGRCVIDASGVTYVDSRGLEVLVDINDRMFQTVVRRQRDGPPGDGTDRAVAGFRVLR